ncbi:MAG: DegV family protein [Lachnospiraceae bacterium]|nr:DegV family protein [Lachnospiraceae bacterium]MBD5511823.1 DegV family protein [Lachnospiraceae bacterium]
MRKYCITTDSNSDLPQEYIDKLNTTIIPQYYSFGDTVYGDELNMPPAEFYERMKKGELPGSQANNPAVIEEKFRALLDKDLDIIHIGFSSALSGSYNNVCMVAKELLEEYTDAKITVIDSLNVSLGESIMVLHANALKDKGASYEEVVNAIEEFKHHINVQFTVDDLFHLQRGGRVSKTTAVVGSALNLKPFLYVSDAGTLVSAGTVRGRKKSLHTLVDRMKATLEENTDYSLPVGIVHGNCLEDAQAVAELVKEQTDFTNIIINDISPSIGTHAGPGALGILYYGQPKKS